MNEPIGPMTFQVETDRIQTKPRMTQSDKWKSRPVVDRWLVWKDLVGVTYRQWKGTMYDIPVMVTYNFMITKGRKVDLDNLIKGVNDALTGIAWEDDSVKQIAHLIAHVVLVEKGEPEKLFLLIEPI